MKKFLVKVFLFITLLILYFGVNMIMNKLLYKNQPLPIKKNSVLIAGDSHPQKCINPEYFNDAQNISQTAEPYILTYWKLKRIFNSFIPDTLILGFAPHNISEFNDLKFSNEKWSREMFKRSYTIEEFDKISNTISVDYSTFYKVLWKQTAFYPKKNHINYIGKYSNNKKNDISDCSSVVKRHFYDGSRELGVSKLAVDYLDSIVRLCNSNNIELILVSNPVHQNYLNEIPSNILNEFNSLTEKYIKDHVVFDHTKEKYADSLYLNCDHLNENGAEIFTKELIDYLNKTARTHNTMYVP